MANRSKEPLIDSVQFTYVGTDKDYNAFLKAVVHSWLADDAVAPAQKEPVDLLDSPVDSSRRM